MKKMLALSVILFLVYLSSFAPAEDWFTNADWQLASGKLMSDKVYFDPSSVKKQGNTLTVIVMRKAIMNNYLDRTKYGDIYNAYRVEIDCSKDQWTQEHSRGTLWHATEVWEHSHQMRLTHLCFHDGVSFRSAMKEAPTLETAIDNLSERYCK